MLYFGLDVQLRRGSVAGYTTDESWAYGPKEGVEAFESITFFIRFIYAINYEHLLNHQISAVPPFSTSLIGSRTPDPSFCRSVAWVTLGDIR